MNSVMVTLLALLIPQFPQADTAFAFQSLATAFAFSPPLTCDFNQDGICDLTDLNGMLAEGPVADGVPIDGNGQFDLNGDGIISNADVDEWLANAASENGLASPYKRGDANLDGIVDGLDFIDWNTNKFTSTLNWDSGNFNGDAVVDGLDFILWNAVKFTSS